jgi:DMSO/TMAO reductase YedYZ molybdopterin-dependent catalytic subunit
MNRPTFPTGALAGALFTAPVIAIFYLAEQLVGLPFLPFDIFDWLARHLPGRVITFGIDTMVAVIRGLQLGPTASAAKKAEQSLAIGGVFVAGIVIGAIFFAVLRRRPVRAAWIPGLVLGAVVGVIALLISLSVRTTGTTAPLLGALWILLLALAWGAALGWTNDRLTTTGVGGAAELALAKLGRRRFLLQLGGSAVAITVVGTSLGVLISLGRKRQMALLLGQAWSLHHLLPNAQAKVQPVPGTRPEFTPVKDHYRIDIDTRPPIVPEMTWRLSFGGLVSRPLDFTLAELRDDYQPLDQFITLACISNPLGGDLISTQRWTGVSLQRILAEVQPLPNATHLRIRSVDDFHETVALDQVRADPRIMLTYAWDGLPLPAEHGFPLRIYIPDRYGMKQPKWITSIEAIDHDEAGYWVQRGWDAVARMRATSVIDTIGANMMLIEANQATRIPIGGIAHAGARGISRVQVRVDGGEWQDAELRTPISPTTWVIWRYEWPLQAGDHTFTVRCFEGDGTPQLETRAPPTPSGATGLQSRQVML